MVPTVTDLDWGEVTVIVMLPAPVAVAAIVSGSVTPPANMFETGPLAGPPPVEQPTVHETPVPERVPTFEVAVIVVPAAIVLPFRSATVKLKLAEVGPFALLTLSATELVGEAICAPEVDMMRRCDTPMPSVVAVHVAPEQVIPLNVPLGPSYVGAL
jgi:hypothetical protein